MAPIDAAFMSGEITRFLQLAEGRRQEQALDEKIGSMQAMVTSMQDRYKEDTQSMRETITKQQVRHEQDVKSMWGTIIKLQDCHKEEAKALRASLQNHHKEETTALQEAIAHLQDRHEELEGDISFLHGILIELQDEVAGLHAAISHAEQDSPPRAAGPRARQGDRSRYDPRPRKVAARLQKTPRHQPQDSQPYKDSGEGTATFQHEAEDSAQPQNPSDYDHDRVQKRNRAPEEQYPRGVKRVHAGDSAEPPRWAPPAEEAKASEHLQPRFFAMPSGRPNQDHACQMPHPKEGEEGEAVLKQARKEAKEEFSKYIHGVHAEYKAGNCGRNERVFICRFIDGIQDPAISRWVQESLKEQYPDKVFDEKQTRHKANARIISPNRNMVWGDITSLIQKNHPDIP